MIRSIGQTRIICFLEDPIEGYKQPAILKASQPSSHRATDVDDDDWHSVYIDNADQYTLTSLMGSVGFIEDSLLFSPGAGRPIVPKAGPGSPLLGFRLTSDQWTGSFGALHDSTLRLLIDDENTLVQAEIEANSDSLQGTLHWTGDEQSLLLTNNGATDWTTTLHQIQVFPDSEVVFELMALTVGGTDSIALEVASGIGARMINWGEEDSCLFRLQIASANRYIEFVDSLLVLPSLTAYTFAPEYDDLVENQLKVYVDTDANGSIDDTIFIANSLPTDVDDQGAIDGLPYRFELSQNYPNPFNPITTIEYGLPECCHVTIEVYNVLGQKVRTLVDREESAGSYTITWDGTSSAGTPVATGVYLYRFQAGDHIQSKKMLLLK
jgi:hypothetical protein